MSPLFPRKRVKDYLKKKLGPNSPTEKAKKALLQTGPGIQTSAELQQKLELIETMEKNK
jgi:hypothetical protein